MWIAGAERGLGARLMVKVTLDAKRGWDRLETKSPGWGSGDRLGGGWKGMIGLLLLTKEEVLRLLAHRHPVRPCQRGQGSVQAA